MFLIQKYLKNLCVIEYFVGQYEHVFSERRNTSSKK